MSSYTREVLSEKGLEELWKIHEETTGKGTEDKSRARVIRNILKKVGTYEPPPSRPVFDKVTKWDEFVTTGVFESPDPVVEGERLRTMPLEDLARVHDAVVGVMTNSKSRSWMLKRIAGVVAGEREPMAETTPAKSFLVTLREPQLEELDAAVTALGFESRMDFVRGLLEAGAEAMAGDFEGASAQILNDLAESLGEF